MPGWEYLFIRAIRTATNIEVETNGHKIERTFSDLGGLYAFCNQLGARGWELIGERQVSSQSVQLIFKRLKE